MKITKRNARFGHCLWMCGLAMALLICPRAARADLMSDIARPLALCEQEKFAEALPLLDKLATRYPNEYLVHYLRGAAQLSVLDEKAAPATNIAVLRKARASITRARDLSEDDKERLQQVKEMEEVIAEGLKALGAPLDEAPTPGAKDAELAALKARIAELEAQKNATTAKSVAPAAKPVASAPKPVKLAPLKPKPGFVSGRVTDELGRPIADAEVGIYGTTMAGENTRFEVITGADGLFSQRVPEGIYGTTAYQKKRFNNQNYRFALPPTDGITAKKHDSTPGIVKEFVWHISGLKPGEVAGKPDGNDEWNKHFGASLSISTRQECFGGDRVYFPKGSTIQLTLTPRGALIDGRPATDYVNRHTFDKDISTGQRWYPNDIPIGLYTLSAQLIATDGTTRALGVQKAGDINAPYMATIPIDFEPTQFGDLVPIQVTVDFETI